MCVCVMKAGAGEKTQERSAISSAIFLTLGVELPLFYHVTCVRVHVFSARVCACVCAVMYAPALASIWANVSPVCVYVCVC